jgi:hypothetical protein
MTTTSSSPENLPAPLALLRMLTGKWVSQAISTAAQLNIADHLANGPKSPSELAVLSRSNERVLCGLLRALASVGVFTEDTSGQFANSPLSEALRVKAPGSMRAMALLFGDHPTWAAWGELAYTVRTGKSSFERVNGLPTFEYFRKHADTTGYFNEAFSANSAQETEAIHRAFDFSGLESLVDVGGGQGALLCSILKRNPLQRGTLFDQPHVVVGADAVIAASGVGPRCSIAGGDFFGDLPTRAGGYILKHVLFNWKDERATEILKAVRRAMAPSSKVFVIDPVILPGPGQTFEKFLDLEMRVLYEGGGERTSEEFRELFAAAGLRLDRIVHTDLPTCSILEASAAG